MHIAVWIMLGVYWTVIISFLVAMCLEDKRKK